MVALKDIVSVERRFALSARLDADLTGSPPLTGYVLQASVRKSLEAMTAGITEGQQYAFTWTGPYGGGKSCAALLVANLVAGCAEQQGLAREIVGKELQATFENAFPDFGGTWKVLPITGRRADIARDLAVSAGERFGWPKAKVDLAARDDRELIAGLEKEADAGGLLILIDELGKFFEHAASDGGDVHLLQDLAERAARSEGRLVVVGILHQAFDQYAERLKKQVRDEWAKVQGRFQNVPFLAQPDEVAALLAKAIVSQSTPTDAAQLAEKTAIAVSARRPVDVPSLTETLSGAWPLHPVTALLLGPLSRQRFAQNERSVFGFLSSAEPHGFQAHLSSQDANGPDAWFGPDELWDYLVTNFGSALAVGADGPRISLAIEAVERAATKGPLCARLAKAAAVIELFRNGSGLAVSDDILGLCAPGEAPKAIAEAVETLIEKAILIRQSRVGGYALFAGSDFDLDEALKRVGDKVDATAFTDLPRRVAVGPVAAKRHYFNTGTLRTFDVIVELAEHVPIHPADWAKAAAERIAKRSKKTTGTIVLLLPDAVTCQAKPDKAARFLSEALALQDVTSAVAVTKHFYLLREHATELYALDHVEASHPQLEGDRIARREIAARRAYVVDGVRRELLDAFATAKWWGMGGHLAELDGRPLTAIASSISDAAFPWTPTIHSELLNRDKPSTSAMAGRRLLAHAMVAHPDKANLGIESFPAERGLYLTILFASELHRQNLDGSWSFGDPGPGPIGSQLRPAWELLVDGDKINAAELYDEWSERPYGMKRGVMPVLLLAFLLAYRNSTAIYVDGLYETAIDDVFVDRLFQDPKAIELQRVRRSGVDVTFMAELAQLLSTDAARVDADALPVAAALFQRFHAIPQWAQRTRTLDDVTRSIRDTVLAANDPEALLFSDLPRVLTGQVEAARCVIDALHTCEAAYTEMLGSLVNKIAQHLGVGPDFQGVAERSETAGQASTDRRIQAFAMRIGAFENGVRDAEGLASLLAQKPARTWTDTEQEGAEVELFRMCRLFREAEALAVIKGRAPTAEAFSLMVGLDLTREPLVRSFEVSRQEGAAADALAEKLLEQLRASGARGTLELAAVARLISKVSTEAGETEVA